LEKNISNDNKNKLINLIPGQAGDCCKTTGVDSLEKTLHTTINECKFSWDSNARRKTIAENT